MPNPQLPAVPTSTVGAAARSARIREYPRLRYMGSKYKLVPDLAQVFAELGGHTALDAFSGSGVVAYTLKTLGYSVAANDFLNFPAILASATVVNHAEHLTDADIDQITGKPADKRDFIQSTFDGLYFDGDDRRFLDSAWSHIDRMPGVKRDLAIASLILSAARKQPRGVFTFTDGRYDDGRRDLRISMSDHFRRAAQQYNSVVFDSGTVCTATSSDIFELDSNRYDLVYLDPPYAPPRDDNCYIKRYHFLEGLSTYWRNAQIMENTKTKKLAKRYTPFSYKRTIVEALRQTFKLFRDSTIVLSYSSNAVPDAKTVYDLLSETKSTVDVRAVEYRYSFGTHSTAERREVSEFIFVGR